MKNIRRIAPPLSLLALAVSAGYAFAAPESPIKVYILAGQSNMVGIGQVGPMGASRMDTFVSEDPKAEKGATLSIYEGAYDPSVDYDKQKPVETHVVMLGYWPHTEFPKIDRPSASVARCFIRIPRAGKYSFQTTGNTILEVDGNEMYRDVEGGKKVDEIVKLDPGTHPLKVTYLGSASSRLSHVIWDVPGTLLTLVKDEGKFPYLMDNEGNWKSRDDVWYKGLVTATANKWLSIGCGASAIQIGPELGFGNIIGDFHEEPVLILKTSQGNRSLSWDFLPPGSERFEDGEMIHGGYKDTQPSWKKGEEPEPGTWYAGKQYDDCFGAAKDVLKHFDVSFPHWKGRSYEIVGFVWFQGNKDMGKDVDASHYEPNLVQLIKTLRKEFDVPEAKFVVAVGCGSPGREGLGLKVAEAQLAVDGDTGKYPEFKGNVKTVETRDFYPDVATSPINQGYHYHQNAGTYMQIGEAMGKAMVELLKGE